MASNSIDPHVVIKVDYSQYDEEVQKLKPTLFREENSYCCLSGPDRETGIFGCGDTVEAAIEKWRPVWMSVSGDLTLRIFKASVYLWEKVRS